MQGKERKEQILHAQGWEASRACLLDHHMKIISDDGSSLPSDTSMMIL